MSLLVKNKTKETFMPGFKRPVIDESHRKVHRVNGLTSAHVYNDDIMTGLSRLCADGLVCMCSGCTCMPVGLSRFHQSLSMPKTKALAKPWSGADRTCNRVRVKDGS